MVSLKKSWLLGRSGGNKEGLWKDRVITRKVNEMTVWLLRRSMKWPCGCWEGLWKDRVITRKVYEMTAWLLRWSMKWSFGCWEGLWKFTWNRGTRLLGGSSGGQTFIRPAHPSAIFWQDNSARIPTQIIRKLEQNIILVVEVEQNITPLVVRVGQNIALSVQ